MATRRGALTGGCLNECTRNSESIAGNGWDVRLRVGSLCLTEFRESVSHLPTIVSTCRLTDSIRLRSSMAAAGVRSAPAVFAERVGVLIEMLEGKLYNFITLVTGVLGLVMSFLQVLLAARQQSVRSSARARWVSVRHRLRGLPHGILVTASCGLFAVLPFVPQSDPPSAKELCDLRDSSQEGYPSLALQLSRSSVGAFVEVQGHGFAPEQVLDVVVRSAGRAGWLERSSVVAQATVDGYFDTTLLMFRYASGLLCVSAYPKLGQVENAVNINANSDSQSTATAELTIG